MSKTDIEKIRDGWMRLAEENIKNQITLREAQLEVQKFKELQEATKNMEAMQKKIEEKYDVGPVTGIALDGFANAFGTERRTGESDEELRSRLREIFNKTSSTTGKSYPKALEETEQPTDIKELIKDI